MPSQDFLVTGPPMIFRRLFQRTFLSFLLLFSISVQAADLQAAFDALKNLGANYYSNGTVCEELAKIQLERTYSKPNYDVVVGIAYADGRRILGELDVVVFNRATRGAELIAEVKCWQNLSKAQSKARLQRERFFKTLEEAFGSRVEIDFFDARTQRVEFSLDQFRGRPQFISISQAGGESAGFDLTLEYTLEELMKLRGELLECQNRGHCKAY